MNLRLSARSQAHFLSTIVKHGDPTCLALHNMLSVNRIVLRGRFGKDIQNKLCVLSQEFFQKERGKAYYVFLL